MPSYHAETCRIVKKKLLRASVMVISTCEDVSFCVIGLVSFFELVFILYCTIIGHNLFYFQHFDRSEIKQDKNFTKLKFVWPKTSLSTVESVPFISTTRGWQVLYERLWSTHIRGLLKTRSTKIRVAFERCLLIPSLITKKT